MAGGAGNCVKQMSEQAVSAKKPRDKKPTNTKQRRRAVISGCPKFSGMAFSVKKQGSVVVAFLTVGAAGLAWANDTGPADKLFKEMEEKLLKAETLQVTLKTSVQGPKEYTYQIGATLFLQAGNKARIEIDHETQHLPLPPTMVSNGTTWKGIAPGVDLPELDTPRNLNRIFTLVVTRGGTSALVHWLRSPMRKEGGAEPDPETWLRISEIKMGDKEKINERSAQAIHYQLKMGNIKPAETNVTLWLDVETRLPVKRVFVSTQGTEEFTATETFHDLKLNEKIAPTQFELGKSPD